MSISNLTAYKLLPVNQTSLTLNCMFRALELSWRTKVKRYCHEIQHPCCKVRLVK